MWSRAKKERRMQGMTSCFQLGLFFFLQKFGFHCVCVKDLVTHTIRSIHQVRVVMIGQVHQLGASGDAHVCVEKRSQVSKTIREKIKVMCVCIYLMHGRKKEHYVWVCVHTFVFAV